MFILICLSFTLLLEAVLQTLDFVLFMQRRLDIQVLVGGVNTFLSEFSQHNLRATSVKVDESFSIQDCSRFGSK